MNRDDVEAFMAHLEAFVEEAIDNDKARGSEFFWPRFTAEQDLRAFLIKTFVEGDDEV